MRKRGKVGGEGRLRWLMGLWEGPHWACVYVYMRKKEVELEARKRDGMLTQERKCLKFMPRSNVSIRSR